MLSSSHFLCGWLCSVVGTEKMRKWVKTQEDNYGGRCTELLEAAMEFIGRL